MTFFEHRALEMYSVLALLQHFSISFLKKNDFRISMAHLFKQPSTELQVQRMFKNV